MAQLVCSGCGATKDVPKVHDGPGKPSTKEPGKLVCPTHGEGCMPTNIPTCCGKTMTHKA